MPRRSRIGNRISTWWISKFAGRAHADTQSGFRVYPRALYANVALRSRRFETETELLLHAARRDLPLVEVPIRTIYGPDRVTHFHGFRDTMRVIRLVVTFTLTLTLTFTLTSCAHQPKPLGRCTNRADHLETLRAEHQVAIDATLPDGKHDQRSLRGVIAVERPDRFRLRALGPGGITLFDLLSVGGRVKVVEAIKDPSKSSLGEIIQSMAGDLAASFLLEPAPPERKITIEKDAVVIAEPTRTVRLSAFQIVNGQSVPARIVIDNSARHYTVTVTASGCELDSPLDPELFKE